MLWVRRKTLASTPDGSRCDKPEYVHRKYPSQTAQDATNRSTGGESHTPPVAAAAAADIEAQLRQVATESKAVVMESHSSDPGFLWMFTSFWPDTFGAASRRTTQAIGKTEIVEVAL